MKKITLSSLLFSLLLPSTVFADALKTDAHIVSAKDGGFSGFIEAKEKEDIDISKGSDLTLPAGVSANTAVIYAVDGGKLSMNGGSLTFNGSSNAGAATARLGGNIQMTGVNVVAGASGNYQTGLYAVNDGTIFFDRGSVKTSGTFGMGILASNGGDITVKNSSIATSGDYAAGVNVGADGIAKLENTVITTSSANEGYGIFTLYGGNAEMDGGSITVNSTGVFSRLGGTVELNDVTIETRGDNKSVGLRAWENGSHITMNGGSIDTQGTNSYGAFAHAGGSGAGGKVTLDNVAITTTGDSSHGLLVWDRSFGELNGGSIMVDSAKNAYAVYTEGTGQVIGSGVYNITGDIRNSANGSVTLDFKDGSSFKGGTDVATGTIDFAMNNSIWNMDKNSTLTSLDLNGGIVNYAIESADYGTLTTDTLSGNNGIFSMRTDIVGTGGGADNTGDLLIVANPGSGNHLVTVKNTGSAATDGTETLTIIDTQNGSSTGLEFSLVSDAEIGAYLYGLRRTEADDTNWELYATGQTSNSGKNSAGLINTTYLLNYVENQTLLQRMGELRHNTEPKDNVWARYYGGRLNAFGGSAVAGSEMKYHGLQLGIDKNIYSTEKKDVYLGLVGGFTRGKLDFPVGDGKTESYYGGFYGTYKHTNGYYLDLIAKYYKMDNDFSTLTAGGDPVHGNGKANGYTASIETGRRLFLNEKKLEDYRGWFIEPQAQLTYGHYNDMTIRSSHGLKTKFNSFDSLIGRIGGLVGYSTIVKDAPTDVYLKVNYLKEFKGATSYTYNDAAKESYSFKGHWLEVGVGVNMQINKKHNLYADLTYADGNKFNQMQVNLGYRYNF